MRDHADVLESVGLECCEAPESTGVHTATDGDGRALLDLLARAPATIDELAESTGRPAGRVLAELTGLELDGRVERSGSVFVIR